AWVLWGLAAPCRRPTGHRAGLPALSPGLAAAGPGAGAGRVRRACGPSTEARGCAGLGWAGAGRAPGGGEQVTPAPTANDSGGNSNVVGRRGRVEVFVTRPGRVTIAAMTSP